MHFLVITIKLICFKGKFDRYRTLKEMSQILYNKFKIKPTQIIYF